MANVFSPNGFQPARRLDGAAWTGQLTTRLIAAANTHKFFRGDPVVVLSTGYIDAVAPGSLPTQGALGIFWGCELPVSATTNSPWSPQYAGAAQASDTTAFVIVDPMVVFRVWVGTGTSSASGGPAVLADLNRNIQYQLGTGNAQSGISGAYVDYSQIGNTATYPFTVVGLVQAPPGVNGTDITTAGNQIEVVMNQSAYKVGTTGIH